MTVLHHKNPELVLISNQELINTREKVWPLFLDFCLKRNPLPEFNGQLSERQKIISDYFRACFTMEKDLALRIENGKLTGFALFDPQNWSLKGEPEDRTIELVIAGSNSKKPWADLKDFKNLIESYKKHKGCNFIAMNIRRLWKGEEFKNYCYKLGFKESQGLFSI